MKYDTLHQAIEATTAEATNRGLEIEFPMVYGGIGYNEHRRWNIEPSNNGRSKKCWQVIITRLDCGRYELVNYYL